LHAARTKALERGIGFDTDICGPRDSGTRKRKSKYNRSYSAGYKPFHVTKILSGGKRRKEREESGRSSYSPATSHDPKYYSLHAAFH
jgi:hypothetical protein